MAGSFSNTSENSILNLIFRKVTWNNIAEDDTTTPWTSFDISLHTGSSASADSEADNVNEATYTGYARKNIGRSTGAWDAASGGATQNTAAITFNPCTGGSSTVTYFKILQPSGTPGSTEVVAWGDLTASLAVTNGITPEFAAGALDVTLD